MKFLFIVRRFYLFIFLGERVKRGKGNCFVVFSAKASFAVFQKSQMRKITKVMINQNWAEV